MQKFIARIRLHHSDKKDYLKLENDLKRQHFSFEKEGNADAEAEFKYYGANSIRQVIDNVLRAASKTGRKFSFTVMKDKVARETGLS